MSFLRHREIYRSDGLGFRESGARSGGIHAPTHRCDEFPAGYSLAGCAPAEPASASPAEQKFTMKAIPRPSFFQRMGKPCLAGCLTSGVHREVLFVGATQLPSLEWQEQVGVWGAVIALSLGSRIHGALKTLLFEPSDRPKWPHLRDHRQ